MNYCFVEDGQVKFGPMPLPVNWKYKDNNITNLPKMSDVELKAISWLVFEEIITPYDSTTHYRNGYNIDIQEDKVVYTSVLVAFTAQELKQNKWNSWISEMTSSDNHGNAISIDRPLEDVLDMLVDKFPNILTSFDPDEKGILKRYKSKKALRATKPE